VPFPSQWTSLLKTPETRKVKKPLITKVASPKVTEVPTCLKKKAQKAMLVAEWKLLPTSKETSFQEEKGQKVQTRSPIEKSFSP